MSLSGALVSSGTSSGHGQQAQAVDAGMKLPFVRTDPEGTDFSV